MRTTIINNYNLKYQFSPNSARRQPSTPEKPMNFNATRHATHTLRDVHHPQPLTDDPLPKQYSVHD